MLGDITEEICDIEDACDDMSEQIDAVDEDLAELEEIIYDDICDCDCDCDCDDEFDFDDCECGCGCEEEEEYYEVECPACGEVICVDDGILEEGSIDCPKCGEKLEFEIEFEEEVPAEEE